MTPNVYPSWVITDSEKLMHDDFRVFASVVWHHLGLPPITWIQADIAEYLQNGPRRRIIEAFRGVGKSWITAAYVLWLLYRDPQHKIMVVSASGKRADAFSVFVKRLIMEVPFLMFLQPRDGQRTSNVAFDVGPATPDQSPSVKSVGITGQLTGSRADTIVADDVEIPSNSATEQQREKLSEAVKEFDAILKPGGQVIYLGTPQVEMSLYNQLAKRGYSTRIWPARFTDGKDEKGVDKYDGKLAPIILQILREHPEYERHTAEPDRFSDLDLAEREASYGRSGFALQFMLDTSLSDSDRYPLKTADLICMDLDSKIGPVQLTWASGRDLEVRDVPNAGLNGDRLHSPMYVSKDAFVPYQGSVMFIDPSGRGKDETAYCVTKSLNSMVFIVAWGGLASGYEMDTLVKLAEIAKLHNVNSVQVESNFGDGMFLALLEPVMAKIHPCEILEYRVTGQKEARIIDKLEPALNQHRVVIDRKVAQANASEDLGVLNGLYQLTHITRDRNSLRKDDRVDVLAEAVGYWMEQLKVDARDQEKRHRDKLHLEELKKHAAICKAGGYRRVDNSTAARGKRRVKLW
jgi:hypothetical protein